LASGLRYGSLFSADLASLALATIIGLLNRVKLNINRGLNRLFVVFATCWYLIGAYFAWLEWSKFASGVESLTEAAVTTVLIAVFPLLIYAFGFSIVWVMRGFKE
jgi:hypothetical protein